MTLCDWSDRTRVKPRYIYSQLRRLDVFVLTHGSFEVLRQYQGAKQFAMDQQLRLETPGGRVLVFRGDPLPDEEVERHRARIMRTQLVQRERGYPF